MVGSINKVILIGNVGKDPEIRVTQEGKEIATFSLATTESWKDKNTGDRREKTEWHRVVIFLPGLVEIIKSRVTKGSRLYIEASLQTREWNDQSGVKKYTTEIVLQTYGSTIIILDSRTQQPGPSSTSSFQKTSKNESGDDFNVEDKLEIDDEIPF
jgi:single-strand DNA-binding protein